MTEVTAPLARWSTARRDDWLASAAEPRLGEVSRLIWYGERAVWHVRTHARM